MCRHFFQSTSEGGTMRLVLKSCLFWLLLTSVNLLYALEGDAKIEASKPAAEEPAGGKKTQTDPLLQAEAEIKRIEGLAKKLANFEEQNKGLKDPQKEEHLTKMKNMLRSRYAYWTEVRKKLIEAVQKKNQSAREVDAQRKHLAEARQKTTVKTVEETKAKLKALETQVKTRTKAKGAIGAAGH